MNKLRTRQLFVNSAEAFSVFPPKLAQRTLHGPGKRITLQINNFPNFDYPESEGSLSKSAENDPDFKKEVRGGLRVTNGRIGPPMRRPSVDWI